MVSLRWEVTEHFRNTWSTTTPLAATASRPGKTIYFLFGPHPGIEHFPKHTFFDALTDAYDFHAF
jgi:hypothetical protein